MAGELVAFVAAAGLGAVIGFERQAGEHDQSVVFGARTFALYAVWGAAAAFFADEFGSAGFAVTAAGFFLLIAAAYVSSSRASGDFGTTTEAAAIAAFVAGVLAWQELFVEGLAIAVGTAALLRSKDPLHSLTDKFSEDDVRAVLQFGVITALVLPLVPDTDLGPLEAFNPREIWLMVVLISAVGLVGYVALRLMGQRGLVATGLLGGLVSSTAVTLGYSRMSREGHGIEFALAAGVLGASSVMYPRVLVEAWVVSPQLARRLVVPLGILAIVVVGTAVIALATHRRSAEAEPRLEIRNPLTLSVALGFALLYAAIVFLAEVFQTRVSAESIQVVGAASGINDVDAITLATANLVEDGLSASIGTQTVLLAVSVNTLTKAALAWLLGTGAFRRTVAAGLVPAGVAGLVIWAVLAI